MKDIYLNKNALWLSVDPLASKYPSLSPYVYCFNNPIGRIDPNGLTDYEVNGKTKRINDGVNNLKISVSKAQYRRLERKFNRNNGGYESYRDKMSVKNGYATFSNSGEVTQNEDGTYVVGEFSMTSHDPGSASYSEWSNLDAQGYGSWKEGMPTDIIVNGQTYVVPHSENYYIRLMDNSLRQAFEKEYTMRNNIRGKYWSPIADMRVFEELMEIYADGINPFSPPIPMIPTPDALAPFQVTRSNKTVRYHERLLKYYRNYNIVR